MVFTIKKHFGFFLIGLLYLFTSIVMFFQLIPEPYGAIISTTIYVATVSTACFLMLRKANKFSGKVSFSLRLIAFGFILGIISGIIVILLSFTHDQISVYHGWQINDTIYILGIPLIVVGFLFFPTARNVPGSKLSSIIDGLLATSGVWLIIYIIWLAPLEASETSLFVQTIAYPAADALIIGIVFSVAGRVKRRWAPTLYWLALGLILWAITDTIYIIWSTQGTFRPDSWVFMFAEAGLLALCIGAWIPPRPRDEDEIDTDISLHKYHLRLSTLSSAVPFLIIIIAWTIATYFSINGLVLSRMGRASVTLITILLIARVIVGWWDHNKLMERLNFADRLYRALIINSTDSIAVFNPDTTAIYASPALLKRLNTDLETFTKTGIISWIHPDERVMVQKTFDEVVAKGEGGTATLTARMLVEGDQWRWTTTMLYNRCKDPAVGGIVANGHDIHHHIELQKDLEYTANHDALTGLKNLQAARKLLAEQDEGAVLLVDLDSFKTINDTHGHPVGDALLLAVAHRLEDSVFDNDIVCRIGGDEFIIILPPTSNIEIVAEKIIAAMNKPYKIENYTLNISASIGVASATTNRDTKEILRDADLAMYAAKTAGKNQWVSYAHHMHSSAVRMLNTANTIREALAGDGKAKLTVAYQPIVRLSDGKIVGVETLARLTDASGGIIAPNDFMKIAEETTLIHEVGDHILRQALKDRKLWRQENIILDRVCVNVSRLQLRPDLIAHITKACEEIGVSPKGLCIELTESAALANPEQAAIILQKMRDLGISIALDDFGTGESSLAQLRSLPIDIIKLDREFALDAHTSTGWALLEGIIKMCSTMGLSIIAEGVEIVEVETLLHNAGAEWGQGFLYAHPLPFEEITELLKDQQNDNLVITDRTSLVISYEK